MLMLAVATSAQAAPVVEAEPSRLVLGPRARAEITVRESGPGLHGAVSIASSVRPEQGRPSTVMSPRVGESPFQKAKSTSVGARASGGGVQK